MFEGVRRFWRRHRGKVVVTGVAVGVGYLLKTYLGWKLQELEEAAFQQDLQRARCVAASGANLASWWQRATDAMLAPAMLQLLSFFASGLLRRSCNTLPPQWTQTLGLQAKRTL